MARSSSLALLGLLGIGLYALSRRQPLAHYQPISSEKLIETPAATSPYVAAGVSLTLPGTYYPSGFAGESGKPGDPYLIYHI